jgi:hypothetical protein
MVLGVFGDSFQLLGYLGFVCQPLGFIGFKKWWEEIYFQKKSRVSLM